MVASGLSEWIFSGFSKDEEGQIRQAYEDLYTMAKNKLPNSSASEVLKGVMSSPRLSLKFNHYMVFANLGPVH